MSDNLTVFGTDYTGVTGIKAKGTGNGTLTYIRPSGTKSITENGTGIDVAAFASVDVSVSGGGGSATLQSKSVSYTPSETAQSATVTADSGYDGLSNVAVDVGAISSTYVGSGITQRSSTDLTASGATVTAPAGYYASAATKSVASGTEGTPTASKGTVSNHAVTVTPSVTNGAGYIAGGTKTGTAVTVAASELVSGNLAITANGTGIDVTEYETVSVSVGGGSSMNFQAAQSTTRATSSTYTELVSLTCDVTGTYDVYWSCYRSSTSGTSGSQLYVGGATSGSANTAFTNHVQNNHRTGVSITAGQEVSVYARSRGSSYYAYVGTLVIMQTA